MSKAKKNQTAGNLMFPKLPNYKAAVYYTESTCFTAEPKKDWNWDQPKNAPDMYFIQEQSLLHENELLLAAKREHFRQQRIKLDNDWQDLETKERSFRESFIRFNKFVRENIEKRERAGVKTGELLLLRQQREHAIVELDEKMHSLAHTKKQMDSKVRQYRMYENFLESVVVASAGEFKGVNEVLFRYETLCETRQELADRQEQALTALEQARNHMAKLVEVNTLISLGLSNRIADLNLRYGRAHGECLHWESLLGAIKKQIIDKLREVSGIKNNCWNMYLKMCERKTVEPELNRHDVENQFIYIKKTLTDLKKIDTILQKVKKHSTSVKVRASKTKGVVL